MDRGVHGKDEAEDHQPRHQYRREPGAGQERSQRQHRRDHREPADPEDREARDLIDGPVRSPQQPRREGLDRSVGDDPRRHKAAHEEERLPRALRRAVRQNRAEIDRDADDEPGVARAEQEHPRQRQPVHARFGREHMGELRRLRAFRQPCGHEQHDRKQDRGEDYRHQDHAGLEPDETEQGGAEEEAEALHRVLGPGEHRDPAEQRAIALGRKQLHRRFRRHLGQVLGHAGQPLHRHHEGHRQCHRPARVQPRQSEERDNLQR